MDGEVAVVQGRSVGARLVVGALLLVRYCSFHDDPDFEPWFEEQRDALRAAVGVAVGVVAGDSPSDFDDLRRTVEGALARSDRHGSPFEATVVDHLVFVTEVLDFLEAPHDLAAIAHAFTRATGLAGDLHALELAARDEGLRTSREFARVYAAALATRHR